MIICIEDKSSFWKLHTRRKLQWFCHTVTGRVPGSLAQVMHGMVGGARTWLTDVVQWTGIGITACVRTAEMDSDIIKDSNG